MLARIMYGKPGWYVLHAAAIGLLFWLGYSARLAGG